MTDNDMRSPNEHLRFAREQFPSRRAPGERLSRQELAELINEWVYDHAGERVELDQNYIGKLERGIIRWPNHRYRQALRAILRAQTDAQLGFYLHRRRSSGATVSDMDRQQFFRLAGSVMALPWLDLFGPTEPTPVPATVGRIEIDQVHTAAKVFVSGDNAYGGGLARDTVVAQLRWSAQLLYADCTPTLRPELFAAVARLCTVAGMMAFDAGANEDARRAFRFGLACAEQSGDWHIRSHLLGDAAVHAASCGRLDEAVTYAELALVRADQLTPNEQARLHTVRARAYAKLQRAQDALAAIVASDDVLSRDDARDMVVNDAPYDQAWHRGHTGQALFDLAMAGQKTQAEAHLASAVKHHRPVRARVIAQTKYASLLMVNGDPYQAAAMGLEALDGARAFSSRRLADDLRELRDHARGHYAIPTVRELSDRITEQVGA